MHYQKVLEMFEGIPCLSVGLDVGAGFTWMSIMLPNGSLTCKPFKIIHSDPQSRELAISKIKEAQEMYSLKSRCFLESTGIYHIPLLCFLRDKGFDCAVINPIITKNSTNMNIRKLHNDKFDSKKAAKVGLDPSLKTSIVPDDAIIDLRNLMRDYDYFKGLQSAIVLKLHAEPKVSFPAYLNVFSKVTTQTSLKLLEAYPLAADMLAVPKDELVETIRCTARFGGTYALAKYDALCAAAKDAAALGRALPSNALRIRRGSSLARRILHMVAINSLKVDKATKAPVNPVIYNYYIRKYASKKRALLSGPSCTKSATSCSLCSGIISLLSPLRRKNTVNVMQQSTQNL